MPTAEDPLAEDDGPCTKCDGGYVTVQPAYAVHLFPDPTAEQVVGMSTEAHQALLDEIETRRAAARNSVYPCRRCNPPLFFRWAGGHLALGHDVLTCSECIELMGGRRAAARVARHLPDGPRPVHTPRRDTDG